MTAGTVTDSHASAYGYRLLTFEWVSSTDTGLVSGTSRHRYTGNILGVCTVPGASSLAPDDNYDITLTDSNEVDVANGQLANRHTSTTQWVFASLGHVVNSQITLNVTNAGNSNAGTTYVYIGDDEADVATLKEAIYGTTGIASFPNAAAPANNVSLAEVVRSLWAGLMGTAAGENGITTWPAAAAPANGVSLAEGLRYVVETQLPAITNQTVRASTVKATTSLATAALFTIAGGPVRVLSLVGQITTAIQAQACATKLTHTPTGGTAVDLSATVEANGAAIRKCFALNGVKATALQLSTDIGVVTLANQNGMPIVLTAGEVGVNAAATNTGAISWYMEYEPLVPGATVTAA